MPQKVVNLALAIAGVCLLALLAVLGVDVYRAARTGPGWKRKLVAAGLLVMAAMGLASCGDSGGGSGGEGDAATIRAGQQLQDTQQWKRLSAVWKEAEEIASGQRGAYPFNEKGKQRVLDSLGAVEADVHALEVAALLSATEGELLRRDLVLLADGVRAKRPTEMRFATCYEPVMWTPAADSLKRLSGRLWLLQGLTELQTLQPQVIEKILKTIESDIGVLADKGQLAPLSAEKQAEAEKVRDQARAHVAKVRAALKAQQAGAADRP